VTTGIMNHDGLIIKVSDKVAKSGIVSLQSH